MFSQSEVQAAPLPASKAKAGTTPTLKDADSLFQSGQFMEAAKEYEALLGSDGTSIAARVGLIRSYLKAEMVKSAYESATAALTAKPDSGALHAAMGEVQFRRGEMALSEREFLETFKTEPRNVHALLGLANIYDSLALHKRAYDMVRTAHDVAPNDPEVQRKWLATLPRKLRMRELQEYLAAPKPDDPETTERMQTKLDLLKALESVPSHRCELVTKIDTTQTDLRPLMHDSQYVRAWGLEVVVNKRKTTLLLDTGASGIVISRGQAAKAGVRKISAVKSGGIGDKGDVEGYRAYAESIRVGGLEFHDCVVHVIDRRSVAGEDGLIGGDVFSSYLVNIDYPGRKLKLSALPARPNEVVLKAAALDTTGESVKDETGGGSETKGEEYAPRDKYIAPGMENWTQVFRFGHMLLLPTRVNGRPAKLFLVDTGSFGNTLSVEYAKEVTKVSRDDTVTVKGLSGSVKKVYQANKAILEFAHLRQQNEDVVTFDLSKFSRGAGTEISGILGFNMMVLLEVKIDYRDGLIDFVYDPKRTHTEYLPTK